MSWKLSKTLFTARPILKSFFILNVFANTSTDRNIFSDISKVNLKIRKMGFINDANVCRCFSTAANGKKGWKLVQVTSCFCWILKFYFKSSLISVLCLHQHIFRLILKKNFASNSGKRIADVLLQWFVPTKSMLKMTFWETSTEQRE